MALLKLRSISSDASVLPSLEMELILRTFDERFCQTGSLTHLRMIKNRSRQYIKSTIS